MSAATSTYYLNLAGEHAWKFGAQWSRTTEDWQDGYKYPDYPNISLAWNRSAHLLWDRTTAGEPMAITP